MPLLPAKGILKDVVPVLILGVLEPEALLLLLFEPVTTVSAVFSGAEGGSIGSGSFGGFGGFGKIHITNSPRLIQ